MEVLDRTVQIGSSILLQGITALSQYIDIKSTQTLYNCNYGRCKRSDNCNEYSIINN